VRTRSNGTSIGAADVDSTQEIQILTRLFALNWPFITEDRSRCVQDRHAEVHGAAYEYDRNTIFQRQSMLRNANARTTPHHRSDSLQSSSIQRQRPLLHSRPFNAEKSKVLVLGQEMVRYVFTDTNTMLVPTLAMRTGDFSSS